MLKQDLMLQIIGLIKVIGFMKEELHGKMSKFVALKPKTYSYLTYNDRVNKKGKK